MEVIRITVEITTRVLGIITHYFPQTMPAISLYLYIKMYTRHFALETAMLKGFAEQHRQTPPFM
jgi:hypothetical protein